MFLRVVAWPMGYVLLAKGAGGAFLVTEIVAHAVHVVLALALVPVFGVTGATMAFVGLYVWHGLFVYALVRRMTGFAWSSDTRNAFVTLFPLVALVFTSCTYLSPVNAAIVGVGVTTTVSFYALRTLLRLVPPDRLPQLLRSRPARST